MGTSSFFVHATELFHGDFGMITEQDMAVLISHSGETEEVLKAATTLKDRGYHNNCFNKITIKQFVQNYVLIN